MNENYELQNLYRKIISISWIIILSVSVILTVISLIFFPGELWYKLTLSFILGSMTNLLAFNLLKNNVSNVTSNARKAISDTISNNFIRLIIYAVVLFISFKSDKLNAYVVATGFLVVRISIYIQTFLDKRKEVK
ncbi:MAG TPA: ATP synthase subunit I [Haloplasmataceae bacterium]